MLNFIIASCIVTMMPGPSMLLVMMNSIQKGLGIGVKTIIGMLFADAILLVLTFSGIGSLIYASATAFAVLKWLGVIYLLYLGIRQIVTKVEMNKKQPRSSGDPLLQGFGTTMLNPKLIGFFLAFFPQFLNHEKSVVAQLAVLGPVFLIIVFVIMLTYALFAASTRKVIESRRGKIVIKNTSGLSLIGCGLFAATMGKN